MIGNYAENGIAVRTVKLRENLSIDEKKVVSPKNPRINMVHPAPLKISRKSATRADQHFPST
jgi:hypothetical protein